MKQRGTMEESRWRKMLVFFILLLQFTGALSSDRDLLLYIPVRAGDDVTLSCRNVDPRFSDCSSTTWLYTKSRQAALEVVNLGKVKDPRSDRLSVSAKCSLVLKKVTAEDVGIYTCRQFKSKTQEGPDATVHLSLVNLTKDPNQNRVTLSCSVVTDECKHRVKWLNKGRDVDKENKEITESSSSCSAAVTFQTSHFIYQERFKDLKCEIKTEDDKVHLFTFSSNQSEKRKTTTTSPSVTAQRKTTTTSPSVTAQHKTTTTSPSVTAQHKTTTTSPSVTAQHKTTTTSPSVTSKPRETSETSGTGLLWLYITLPLVLLLLIITIGVFVVIKTKGKKRATPSKGGNLRPPETQPLPENQQHEVDPDNGVSYASISYNKTPNSSRLQHDDEDDTVTYSTVKASSTDPSVLYASVKKPNKPV